VAIFSGTNQRRASTMRIRILELFDLCIHILDLTNVCASATKSTAISATHMTSAVASPLPAAGHGSLPKQSAATFWDTAQEKYKIIETSVIFIEKLMSKRE
jgi:hypothetical protein